MLPIDPIGLGGAGGHDRVLAVQRVMDAAARSAENGSAWTTA